MHTLKSGHSRLAVFVDMTIYNFFFINVISIYAFQFVICRNGTLISKFCILFEVRMPQLVTLKPNPL